MGLPSATIGQIIQEALDCIDKTSSKLSLSGWDNMEKFDACVDVILTHHQYKNKSVEEYFLGLKCSDKFVRVKILGPALNSLKNDEKITIKKFNQKISEYESENVSRDDKNWYFIYPVNFRLKSNGDCQEEFEISENVIQLLDFDDFMNSDFGTGKVLERLKTGFRDYKNLNRYSWCIIKGEGNDALFALDYTVKILNKFLGTVNLSYWIYRQRGFRFTSYPRVSGYTEIVTPSYVLQYNTNKEFEGLLHFEVGPAVNEYVDFRDKKYERLKTVFESLNNLDKKSEVYEIIWEAIALYNSALNEVGYDPGFLDLWTGLERMTFKRRTGRDNDVPYYTIIWRLLGIMINPPEIFEIRLKDMLNKRHKLVHGGHHDIISESDFNFLKLKYEMVLIFLMNHNNKFKTIDEIELIYDKSCKKKEELECESEVINYVVGEREKLLKNRKEEAEKRLRD